MKARRCSGPVATSGEYVWKPNENHWFRFYRAMLCIRGRLLAMGLCLSVCPSVCPSQVGVLLKRLNVGWHKQNHTIAQGLVFYAKDLRDIRLRGHQMQEGWVKVGDFRQPNDLASRPHVPQGLNIPATNERTEALYSSKTWVRRNAAQVLTYRSYHLLLDAYGCCFCYTLKYRHNATSTVYTIFANSRNSRIFTLRYPDFGCHKING